MAHGSLRGPKFRKSSAVLRSAATNGRPEPLALTRLSTAIRSGLSTPTLKRHCCAMGTKSRECDSPKRLVAPRASRQRCRPSQRGGMDKPEHWRVFELDRTMMKQRVGAPPTLCGRKCFYRGASGYETTALGAADDTVEALAFSDQNHL
jgi:hypothetical protein